MENDRENQAGGKILNAGRFYWTAFLVITGCLNLAAQNGSGAAEVEAMQYGERIVYDVYFKWGLFLSRAGEASFSYEKYFLVDGASSRYQLLFKTTSFFDGFFKMRDTIRNYYDDENKLQYSVKHSDEGGYYLIDELTFDYEKEAARIRSFRYTPSRIKIDTTLVAEGEVMDMLGVIYYLRRLNRDRLATGAVYPVTVAIGRDLVKLQLHYQGKAVISHGGAKYDTHYFKMNIYDKAFENTSASAEVWVGDDDNFLPVKVRTKLKVGYVEVYFKQADNPAHPLKCRRQSR